MACLVVLGAIGLFVVTPIIMAVRTADSAMALKEYSSYIECNAIYPSSILDFKKVHGINENDRLTHVHVMVNCSNVYPEAKVLFQATVTYPEQPVDWVNIYADDNWARKMVGKVGTVLVRSDPSIIKAFVLESEDSIFPPGFTRFRAYATPLLLTEKIVWQGYYFFIAIASALLAYPVGVCLYWICFGILMGVGYILYAPVWWIRLVCKCQEKDGKVAPQATVEMSSIV